MIKLFSQTDTSFSSNGDKVIIPLRAKIHKEDNGSFYLDLDADLSYVNDLPFIISASAFLNNLNGKIGLLNKLTEV